MLPFLAPILGGLASAAVGAGAKALFSGGSGGCSTGTCGSNSIGGSMAKGGGSAQRFPIYSQKQRSALNQLLKQGLGQSRMLTQPAKLPAMPNLPSLQQYQDMINRASFAPIRKEALSSLEQGIPSLAERFAELGGNQPILAGLVSSQRGNLEDQLAALQQQFEFQRAGLGAGILGQQAEQALRRYGLGSQYGLAAQQLQRGGIGQTLGFGLQPPFNTYFQPPAPPQPGFGATFGAGLGQALGNLGPLAAAYGLGFLS